MTRLFGPGWVETLLLKQVVMLAGYAAQIRAGQQAEAALRKQREMEMANAQAEFYRLSKQRAGQ